LALSSLSYAIEKVHAAQGRAAVSSCSHAVHFYEDDSSFLDNLSEFVGAALGAGGACVVIATRAHRDGLVERLKACGIDTRFATHKNRYIALDAAETLARFMVDGWPDEGRFLSVIEPELVRARMGLPRKSTAIVAFGEMVALLLAEGNAEAAIRLEQIWNKLADTHAFSLRCAYPVQCFADGSQDEAFLRVCAEHSQLVPAESYTALSSDGDRMRLISDLQRKAQSLNAALELRAREVGQRIEVEEKLRRTEEFANQVVENSVDCVKVLDLEGRLKYMSPPGLRAMEIVDVNEVLGRRWVDFWSEEEQPRAEEALAIALAGGIGSFHGECATVSGIKKSWDVKISPSRGPHGEIERLIAVSRDITELKFAQQAIIQTEKLAATGRMAATIAHEINNPLEAVTNFIYLARTSEGVPEEVCRHLEIADRELARVAQIAQQTLGFYRDNTRDRWVSVGELVSEVVSVYERKLRAKGLGIEIDADPELMVHIKQGELKQAVSNLLANAIDATQSGGKLWLRAQAAKNWTNGREPGVRITMADNGSGMTPEVQKRIFIPFFTTKAEVGTGIGLWVTKCLIERQGGDVHFRSRQGLHSGTVMCFFVPLEFHEHAAA
jgi:PAS domain S-box-containing protein